MIKNVRILGINYPVEVIDMQLAAGNHNAGSMDTTGCKIFVSSSINTPEHQKAVLLHEIIEALNYRLELNLEHAKITQLESGLFSVFQDNPELLKLFGGPDD